MSKSFRVRTEVGKDKNVTFEIKQDFDLLEILSLSLSQQDVYTRMCADFGVLCGRVIVNGGYGVPNAKVAVFVPLAEEDADKPLVTELYPYTHISEKNEDGVRYNLLSKEKNFDCHIPVGTFPLIGDVLTRQEVEYVYKKYYKYTVKTNESGDFMIYGAPVGTHDILMDVDVSDIGCFSLLPQDFKEQGFPNNDFDGARFKRNTSIDSLPQIMSQTKSVDIRPFWGDEEFCRAAITRVDFDLSDNGFKIAPSAVFMGSTGTDTDKDSVNKSCRPKKHQGDLCSLVSEPGIIDCVRYTPFFKYDANAYGYGTIPQGGTVPVLERYYFENNGRVIDSTGAFLVHMPMNLDHMTTNEFGELVKSGNPDVGVPTRARCRFRVRPEQSAGSARLRRKANYLVPNIREYDTGPPNNWIDRRSYTFSTNYSSYHPHAQTYLIPAAKDYFYDMTFNRVYSPAQFHDHVKHNGRRQFIGVKEILPEEDQQCSTTAVHFPINSAVRKVTFMLILAQFINEFLGMLYAMLIIFVGLLAFVFGIVLGIIFAIIGVICSLLNAICGFFNGFPSWLIKCPGWLNTLICQMGCGDFCFGGSCFLCQGPGQTCIYFGIPMGFVLFTLRQTKYPECEKCKCRGTMGELGTGLVSDCNGNNFNNLPTTSGPCSSAGPIYSMGASMGTWGGDDCCGGDDTLVCCPDNYGFDSASTGGPPLDFAAFGGCYVKVVCFNIDCMQENFNMELLRQWIRRQNVADSLCAGIMNYFWENAWVTGFLYQFQFKAKLAYDAANDNYNNSDYCKRVVWIHPNDHVFYYRSTPYLPNPATGLGVFQGDPSGVAEPWWGWFGGAPEHADGDQQDHILFPTTITDMGSRNQCIQDICLDPRYAEECSVTDQIGSTSFQDITELVSDIYNLKANDPSMLVASMFNRPEKEIGGDVAQAIMQNCMVGIYGYETNMSNVDCDCSGAPPVVNNVPGLVEYPPSVDQNTNNTNVVPNVPPGTYVQYAVNVNPNWSIEWEPHLFTAATSTIMSGLDLQYCLGFSLSASTQELPFYPWRLSNVPWGNQFNDWAGTTGFYNLPTIGVSSPMIPFSIVNNNWSGAIGMTLQGPWGGASGLFQGGPGGPMGAPPFQAGTVGGPGSFQVTWGPGPNNNFPPLSQSNNQNRFQMSGPLFYYFGLRPGETSYHTFIRMYVDEELADSVL
jgi:hypothetical protein